MVVASRDHVFRLELTFLQEDWFHGNARCANTDGSWCPMTADVVPLAPTPVDTYAQLLAVPETTEHNRAHQSADISLFA